MAGNKDKPEDVVLKLRHIEVLNGKVFHSLRKAQIPIK
jgi:hypothetical protein